MSDGKQRMPSNQAAACLQLLVLLRCVSQLGDDILILQRAV